MRVITGSARGRKLLTLEGEDVRPTTDKVKEAVFSVIQFETEGRRVLDLFAGSGQLGIEALSRGAAGCVFIDRSRQAVSVIKKNIEACGFGELSRVYQADSADWLCSYAAGKEHFDIAFIDPPYMSGLYEKALPLTAEHMNRGGVIICEAPAERELPERAGEFTKRRVYRYGRISVTFYRHEDISG